MVKATFTYKTESNKPILLLSVDGHAGAGNFGEDIVCSACSILSYTLAQTLLLMKTEGRLRKKPRVDIKEGKAKIVAEPKAEALSEILSYFYMTYVGFCLLHENYPQFVDFPPFTGFPDKDTKEKESLA